MKENPYENNMNEQDEEKINYQELLFRYIIRCKDKNMSKQSAKVLICFKKQKFFAQNFWQCAIFFVL